MACLPYQRYAIKSSGFQDQYSTGSLQT